MPAGPSLVILREQAQVFEGRRILRVEGNTTIDTAKLKGRMIEAIRTWGKHFLVELPNVALRIGPAVRRTCPRCDLPFPKGHLGLSQRRSFWCENCQVLHR